VPVGARSFRVNDASGFQVGDTVIVHRPSTAEWITAIGMDQIPERSDGLPVTQWQAGSYDLFYDRIVTAIDGNRITIDAPLANSLESRFGGGTIYRYTYPGRISQVGVERIRGISDFNGTTWTTSSFDEDHAWKFITLDHVQNAWVRNVAALHFGFGNTEVGTYAKWVTVQDSQNLLPVSTISGSRRYPFYILGQLSLVQRCYANYARHDYGTSSRTHGPNVFLDSSADYSYSDTGPHHRWATGTLYDNIVVLDNDIVVQNRLNFGSGHGWAGANHVIWNSIARRITAQNPPTAQNWAIGVRGTKWAGAFPAYAQDGYWISHGTPVEPRSLYLKQLEDRLAPEGPGGLITILSFNGTSEAQVVPGEQLDLPLRRLGVRDGSTLVEVRFEGEGAELLEPAGEAWIPAGASDGTLGLRLRKDAVLGEERRVTVQLVPTAQYSPGVASAVEVILPAGPRALWRREHFSEAQLEDPSISGDDADPAGDGVPNLLKYAFNLSPWTPVRAGDLPLATREEGYLTLTYSRGLTRTDLQYQVEVSEDLVNWNAGAGFTEEVSVTGDGEWQLVTIRDRLPISDAPRRFIRLRVDTR
jgi:hypothetical protein